MNDEIRAKALIESGSSLHEIARCFSRSLDAYYFYATTLQDRFTPEEAVTASQCACGKHASGERPQQITWRAVTHSRGTGLAALFLLLLGHITSGRVDVKFTTVHRYCRSCASRLWWSFSLLRFAKSVLFAVLLLALFVTVPLVVITGAVLFSARDLLPGFSLCLVGGLVLLFLIYLCYRRLWTTAVPLHLRFIARFPFEPLDIRAIDENAA